MGIKSEYTYAITFIINYIVVLHFFFQVELGFFKSMKIILLGSDRVSVGQK